MVESARSENVETLLRVRLVAMEQVEREDTGLDVAAVGAGQPSRGKGLNVPACPGDRSPDRSGRSAYRTPSPRARKPVSIGFDGRTWKDLPSAGAGSSLKRTMKTPIRLTLAAAAILFGSGCSTQKSSDPSAPTGPPDATLTFDESQGGYDVAGGSGRGTVMFQGRSRSFSVKSIGAGGTGIQRVHAVGEVYNLETLEDFEGAYTGARSGLTLFKGKMHERIENDRGVVIYITGQTSGLASSLGMDKVYIKLE